MSQHLLFEWRKLIASNHGPESSSTRHVLLTLSLHMNLEGDSCFPSTALLATETAFSEHTVCKHLGIAEEAGWIEVYQRGRSGRGWRRHGYRATIPAGLRQEDPAADTEPEGRGTEAEGSGTEAEGSGTESDVVGALRLAQSNSSVNTTDRTPGEEHARALVPANRNRDPITIYRAVLEEWKARKGKAGSSTVPKSHADLIRRTLSEQPGSPDDLLDAWETHLEYWLAAGYVVPNIADLLDAFRKRNPTQQHYGTHRTAPAGPATIDSVQDTTARAAQLLGIAD